MMAAGSIAFVVQSLFHESGVIWSMLVTNAVTFVCSGIVFAIKIYNDYFKKK